MSGPRWQVSRKVRDGLNRMYSDYDQYGFPGGNAVVLRATLGREPRSLRSFIAEIARGEERMASGVFVVRLDYRCNEARARHSRERTASGQFFGARSQ